MSWDHDIRTAVDAILDDQRWKREAREQEVSRRFGHSAGHFLRTLSRLTNDLLKNPQQLDGPNLVEMLQELTRWNLLRNDDAARGELLQLAFERVDAALYEEASVLAYRARERLVLHLAPLARPEVGSARGREFFARVARSYIWGFELECVIMCGAGLEAELVAEVRDDDCYEQIPQMRQRPLDLRDRIEIAQQLGRLTSDERTTADRIRQQRNRALHANPMGGEEALETIAATLKVLAALDRTRES